MNIPITPHSQGLNDLFFRTADRMRLEGCVNAVAHEGLSLALSCTQEALLDHYVQQLLLQLRQAAPEHRVEVYFPANTESLIARFNDALASQSLREATRNGKTLHSRQIWLVHDAQTLPDHELQLLARLIQNFPGAHISAVLLMIGQAPEQQTLSAFGRKLLRWDIELPTEEQRQATLELARVHGQAEAMTLLLRRMGKPRGAAPTWTEEAPMHADPASDRPSGPRQTASADALPGSEAAQAAQRRLGLRQGLQALQRTLASLPQRHAASAGVQGGSMAVLGQMRASVARWRQRGPLVAAGVGALALSVLLMMWIQPGAFGLKGQGRAAPPIAATAPESTPPLAQAMAAQTPVVSATTAPAPAPVTDLPDAVAQAQEWARTLTPQHFVIQHGSYISLEKAQQLMAGYPSLAEARIVATYRPGDRLAQFVVVSGPYPNAGKAYERFARKDLPGNSWVRGVQSLQQQLEPTAKESR